MWIKLKREGSHSNFRLNNNYSKGKGDLQWHSVLCNYKLECLKRYLFWYTNPYHLYCCIVRLSPCELWEEEESHTLLQVPRLLQCWVFMGREDCSTRCDFNISEVRDLFTHDTLSIGHTPYIAMKQNNLYKRVGWKKATRVMPKVGVLASEWYKDKNNKHLKNEALYTSLQHNPCGCWKQVKRTICYSIDSPPKWIANGRLPVPQRLVWVRFWAYQWWCTSISAPCSRIVIIHCIKEALHACQFFNITCDEMITVDNCWWISIQCLCGQGLY